MLIHSTLSLTAALLIWAGGSGEVGRASAREGGLGWFIFVNRSQLETANVFAGLLAVILIGLTVESLVFATLNRLTVQRWEQEA